MFLAEKEVRFVLHVPFVMPQINKYFIFLLMSPRSELSSSCEPWLTGPCAFGVGCACSRTGSVCPEVGDTAPLSELPHLQQKHLILATLLWHFLTRNVP